MGLLVVSSCGPCLWGCVLWVWVLDLRCGLWLCGYWMCVVDVLRPIFVAKRHLSMCNSERTGRTHRKIGYNSVSVEWSSNSSMKLMLAANESTLIDINTFTIFA